MATYQYKFALLADPDVSANQSRGLSLQFNGFSLISLPSANKDWIADKLNDDASFTLDDVVKQGGTVIYRDISYIVNDGYVRSNDTKYNSAVVDPGSHMFQGLVVEAAEEIKLSYGDGELDRGSCVIEIPLYDTMFGDRVRGEFEIDAIVLYGQAYNTDFYSDTQQGKIERSVPIGIVGFTDSTRPDLNPSASSDSKTKFTLKFAIQVAGVQDVTGAVENSSAYESWKKFAGTMHVVNDNLLTTSSYVISGHDLAERDNPLYKYDEGIYASSAYPSYNEETIDFKSRLFFTNDVQEDQWDHNVDFGSPARLTILSNASAVNEYRTPQFMLGKVGFETDGLGYVHGSLDGVVESYFMAQGTNDTKGREEDWTYNSGSVYDVNWISKSKPGCDFFSDWLYTEPSIYTAGHRPHIFQETDYSKYLAGGDDHDLSNWAMNSACFANGNNLFAHRSLACYDGTNMNTADVISRGNNLVMNSSRVKCYTRHLGKDDELANRENRHLYRYNALIANSQDVNVFTRVKGKDGENERNNPLVLILNSNYVKVDNSGNGETGYDTTDQARSVMIGCNRTAVTNGDNDVLVGIKGWSAKTTKAGVYNQHWSTLTNGKNNIFMGGLFTAENAKNCRIFGTGSDASDRNTIEGSTDSANAVYSVNNSFILGRNCHLVTKRERASWESVTAEPTYSNEFDVFMVGKGLKNDIRQSHAYHSMAQRGPTILLGWNNQEYFQEGVSKQIVIGGYRSSSTDIPDFKYNGFELTYAHPESPITWTEGDTEDGTEDWVKETMITLQDVKGRAVDYGSEAINLGFMKGRSDENYSKYAFKGMGRINLFKLYNLLKHMYWEYGADGKPVVRVSPNLWSGESDGPLYWNAWDRYGSTCLANLVDDNFCYRAFGPQAPANK